MSVLLCCTLFQAGHSHIKAHRVLKHENDLETSVLGIHFVANAKHFTDGKLRVSVTLLFLRYLQPSAHYSVEEEGEEGAEDKILAASILIENSSFVLFHLADTLHRPDT